MSQFKERNERRVAVITGAASGLGQAFAIRLAEVGYSIAIADHQPADETVAIIKAKGSEAWAAPCDLSDPAAIRDFTAEVNDGFGRCDVLVNNAAYTPLCGLDDTDLDTWRRVMAVNLDAAFLLAQAFAPGMRQRSWGRIINLASSNTGRPQKGFFAYIASKSGVIGLTRALAAELGEKGVTVNAISPGLIKHPGSAAALPETLFSQVRDSQLLKRTGEPNDLCGVLAFLASDASGYITGQVFNVDGGFLF
ncbi:SDR family oxidoreductase [Pseudomonas sp. LTJR-52]|uniref:SDR family NAD(P)-dependent oxidoreductase n=1 Tax=Pseudomonas sp. LTJR-52 TaxID=2479392 RepID=UPI000EFD0144|nr:SDR family oxidoreductase [Pseudomonas sp. LTJR-52]AYN97007.1 SDR family oxidoreductase [Pseudomonas sp. LTJR-52]